MEEKYLFTDSHQLNTYLYGGNAVVVLEGPHGTHHTYVYSVPKNSEVFPCDVRFVYCLHDGTTQFYLGMIDQDKFRLTRNSRFLEDTEIVKGAKYIEKLRKDQNLLSTTPMKIYHTGRCARCGRLLTTTKAIEQGFGKKCFAHLNEHKFFADYIIPGKSFVGKIVV